MFLQPKLQKPTQTTQQSEEPTKKQSIYRFKDCSGAVMTVRNEVTDFSWWNITAAVRVELTNVTKRGLSDYATNTSMKPKANMLMTRGILVIKIQSLERVG
ncbi:MAG TPA: hypothetical protein VH500_07230 [Nitrososphaeraceae archaeon]